jgi:hypothetical protein
MLTEMHVNEMITKGNRGDAKKARMSYLEMGRSDLRVETNTDTQFT